MRFIVQVVFYLLEWVLEIVDDLATSILVLIWPTEYIRISGCAQTGQCCQAIGMGFPRWWRKMPWLLNITKAWHGLRYNFKAYGDKDNLLVYHCLYLKDGKTCGIQRFKPKLCRDFPKTPLFGFTKLHKGCGYSFIRRDGSDFERVILGIGNDPIHVVPHPEVNQSYFKV